MEKINPQFIKAPEYAVIFRLSAMGDVALLTGVLNYWYQEFGTKFIVISREAFLPLFENNPAIHQVQAVDISALKGKAYRVWCQKIAEKYKEYPLFDMHGTMRSRILRRYWQSKTFSYDKNALMRRVFLWTKGRFGSKRLLEKNVCQRYAGLLDARKIEREKLKPQIFLTQEEKEKAREMLICSEQKKIIAIHPFATHSAKSFTRERWLEIAQSLQKEYKIVWIGMGQDITDLGKSFINTTSLRELCALLSQCDLLLTGDSGPMHLANAVDTPLVAIFGPTCQEWGFFPVGEKSHVIQVALECRPCSLHGSKNCTGASSCFSRIENKTLFDVVHTILKD